MKRTWLEVVGERAERLCIDGFPRILIGSAPYATVRMRPQGFYAREHAALTRLGDRWQLADLGSAGGVYMNKAQMKTARWLDSGDIFYMHDRERFRFVEEPVDPRWEAHAARLAASDDGESAWLVFSDALQELGDEVGKRMLTARESPAMDLGILERMRGDSTVTFSCGFGFAHSVTIRNQGMAIELREHVIDAVLRQPVMRLVRVLELDVASFGDLALETLAAAVTRSAPASLRTVRLLGVFGVPPKQLFGPSVQVEAAPI